MSDPYQSGTSTTSTTGMRGGGFEKTTKSTDRNTGNTRHRAHEASEEIKRVGSATKDRLYGFANRQKDAGIEQVFGFAQAAHKAADSLEEQNSGLADLVHEAADGLDRVSNTLRNQDVSQIYGTVHDFARRQPMAFLAGSLAAGIVLARFLKSSADHDGSDRKSVRETQSDDQKPYRSSPSLSGASLSDQNQSEAER